MPRPHSPLLQNGGFVSIATILFYGPLRVANRSMQLLEELAKVEFRISIATEVFC